MSETRNVLKGKNGPSNKKKMFLLSTVLSSHPPRAWPGSHRPLEDLRATPAGIQGWAWSRSPVVKGLGTGADLEGHLLTHVLGFASCPTLDWLCDIRQDQNQSVLQFSPQVYEGNKVVNILSGGAGVGL